MMESIRISSPLYDYGKAHAGVGTYEEISPDDPHAVMELVREASLVRRPLRVRGSGHTFSGASLPRQGELLVRTNRLDHFRFESDGTLTAGAGAMVWDIRDLAREHGLDLPVFNGGWAGPTLGGYINAAGIGKGNLSELHGGLWENVEKITIVDGFGELRRIDRDDPLFPWMFGSWGQLGILIEARLRLVRLDGSQHRPFPSGLAGRIPQRQTDDPAVNALPPERSASSRLLWFSLFVRPEQEAKAWEMLERFVDAHPDVIPTGGWAGPKKAGEPMGYHYQVVHKNFHPPLVYPYPEDFLVLGVMAFLKSGTPASNQRLFQLERDFLEAALASQFRLYPQAENVGGMLDLSSYYGRTIWQSFQVLRRDIDPREIINPGFFERLAPQPQSTASQPRCVVFLGPSLAQDRARALLPDEEFRPPAKMGDIYRLLGSGVRVIVLIDGYFHDVPAVWHREILAAVDAGMTVIGAASMGALRAAELHSEGMLGVGEIFRQFHDGHLEGDDEVALLHGESADGYRPFAEALVNLRDLFARATTLGILNPDEAQSCIAELKGMSFVQRSLGALWKSRTGRLLGAERQTAVEDLYQSGDPPLKARDSVAALRMAQSILDGQAPPRPSEYNGSSVERFPCSSLLLREFEGLHGRTVSGADLLTANYHEWNRLFGREIRSHAYLRLWIEETGPDMPEDLAELFVQRLREKSPAVGTAPFLVANRLLSSEFEWEVAQRSKVEWLLAGGVDSFLPAMNQAIAGTMDLRIVREAAILKSWCHRIGVEAPARITDTMSIVEWLMEVTPSHFGEEWDDGPRLLRSAQFHGLVATCARRTL